MNESRPWLDKKGGNQIKQTNFYTNVFEITITRRTGKQREKKRILHVNRDYTLCLMRRLLRTIIVFFLSFFFVACVHKSKQNMQRIKRKTNSILFYTIYSDHRVLFKTMWEMCAIDPVHSNYMYIYMYINIFIIFLLFVQRMSAKKNVKKREREWDRKGINWTHSAKVMKWY